VVAARACVKIGPLPLSLNKSRISSSPTKIAAMAYSGATGDNIELVRRDSDDKKDAPSGDAVADVRIDVEEAKNDSQEEPHGSSESQVKQKDESRIDPDGAVERANRGRDIYWVSAYGGCGHVHIRSSWA
jgi:hypothetical protein